MASGVTTFSSYSTNAVRVASDTDADDTPAKLLRHRSTLAAHAEHAMPTTGIVRLSIFLFFYFFLSSYCLLMSGAGLLGFKLLVSTTLSTTSAIPI
jgi:hypothetical protein